MRFEVVSRNFLGEKSPDPQNHDGPDDTRWRGGRARDALTLTSQARAGLKGWLRRRWDQKKGPVEAPTDPGPREAATRKRTKRPRGLSRGARGEAGRGRRGDARPRARAGPGRVRTAKSPVGDKRMTKSVVTLSLYTSRSGLASFSPAASLTQWPHRDEVYLQRCAPTPRGLDIHGLRTAPPSYQMPPRDLAMSGPLEEAADAGGPGAAPRRLGWKQSAADCR